MDMTLKDETLLFFFFKEASELKRLCHFHPPFQSSKAPFPPIPFLQSHNLGSLNVKACFRKITLSTDFVCLYSAAAIVLQTGNFLTQPTFSLYMYRLIFRGRISYMLQYANMSSNDVNFRFNFRVEQW